MFQSRWVGHLKIMMYLTINGQFENSHGTLFLLPWLVDDEVNGKPKKLMCRAAAVCYSKLFLGGKKKRCFTQSVSLYTEDFYPLFEWSFLHYCQAVKTSNMIQIASSVVRWPNTDFNEDQDGRLIFKCVITKNVSKWSIEYLCSSTLKPVLMLTLTLCESKRTLHSG